MKINKEKRMVNIVCNDGFLLKGFMHLDPGLRISDLLNQAGKGFIPVTVVEIYYIKEAESLKVTPQLLIKRDVVMLNCSAIKWVEETQ